MTAWPPAPWAPLAPKVPFPPRTSLSLVASPRSARSRAKLASQRLAEEYPGTAPELCELDFSTPWELLVATVLSAQTTDQRVNAVTPALFARYPRPADVAAAGPEEVEDLIRPTGFFRVKARTLVALGEAVEREHRGDVPASMEELVKLPGVGRKTANVVLSVGFGLPGLPVDTHVGRISRLLALTAEKDPEKVEADLCAELPPAEWGAFSLRLILHGRRVCIARRPRCERCMMADFCPSAALPLVITPKKSLATVARPAARAGKAPTSSAPSAGSPRRAAP